MSLPKAALMARVAKRPVSRAPRVRQLVDAKGVERVVVAEAAFYFKDHEGAECAGNDADKQRRKWLDKSGGWGDGNESGDSAGDGTESGRFAVVIDSATVQPRAAAAAAKWVLMKALVASGPEPRAEPGLNPNHPTQSRQAPMKLRTME